MKHEATTQEITLLRDIRVAAGDPTGKLMQPELVQRIAAYREADKVLRQIASGKRKTREQRMASACILFLDALGAK